MRSEPVWSRDGCLRSGTNPREARSTAPRRDETCGCVRELWWEDAEVSPPTRNFISRGTLLVVAIVLLWSGVSVIRSGTSYHREWQQQRALRQQQQGPMPIRSRQRDPNPALYLWPIGGLLLLGGAVVGIGALAPTSWLEEIGVAPVTGERDTGSGIHMR